VVSEPYFNSITGRRRYFYHGKIWDVVSKEPITTGEEVEIVGFDEMKLLVQRKV
jgi:membrane protein implicated in regulation of membrane protease activity